MTPEQRQTLIHELREFARAYPENIFTPFTEEELKRHSVIITRASAAAGRHFAPWFLKAAAALAQIDADEGLMGSALRALMVGQEYEKAEWDRAKRQCSDHGWHRADGEEIQTALDHLRARLGEVPAQGEEAEDGEAKG